LNHTLAIIGGGVAGLMSCQQAIAQNKFYKILWFRADPNSLGTAYDTRCPAHLLNVPAKLMGLDPELPTGFFNWLAAHQPGRFQPDDFVPRMEFAAYMQAGIDALDDRVQQIHQHAVRADKTQHGWRISTLNQRFDADALLLATGFPLAQLPTESADLSGVFEAWHWFSEVANTASVQRLANKVLLVGSGLTAVDMVLALRALGYMGQIEVVSSSGRWPLQHAISEPLFPPLLAPILAELSACTSPASVIATLRRAAKTQPWRAVLDALRPHTNTVWTSWPASLRLTLVQRAYSFWGQHRHRVPPQTLAAVVADPRVSLRKGRVKIQNGCLSINEAPQPAGQLTLFCVGARFSDGISPDPLLAPLVQQGLLKANALNIGLIAANNISLALIGARRFGELFETVAVPELRQQAELAVRMLSNRAQAKIAR
jgi:uncharacterized NAD(P)/FAD-binding protein YdhS